MRGCIGLILVTMSMLRPGDCGTCGALYFDRCSYNVGWHALLIYKPLNHSADRQWLKDGSIPLQTKSSQKYHEENQEDRFELTIYSIDEADAGWYSVKCAPGYFTNYTYLTVSASSDELNCGMLKFEDPNVYKGASANLIYTPCQAMAPFKWYKDGPEVHLLRPNQTSRSPTKYTELKRKRDFILRISDTETADFGNYFVSCGKQSNYAELNVRVDPEAVDIKTRPTKETGTSNVQCTTINGRPPFRPLFYLEDILQNSVSIQKTNQSGYTYNVTATLLRNVTRQDNQASVRCCSDSSPRVCSATEYLNVTFSPKSVVLKEISKVNKENGDTVLVLKCDVDESNPKSFVDWKGVKNLPKQLLEEKYINHTATHGWTYTTNWLFILTKEDRRRKIICQVNNSEFPDLRLHDSYMPYITYSPVINTSAHGSKIVFIGDDVMLSCYVDSNPLSVITWYNKTNKMKESNGTNTLDLHLVNVTIEHSQTYTCTARNGIGGEATKDITLSVKVPSKKTSSQPCSETHIVSLLVPAIGGAVVITIAIATVVVFLTLRKKKNDAAPKRKGMHQINDERRHESVHPARNDLYTSLSYSEDKSEYASIIPIAKRKSETDHLKSEDAPEFAGVIPKAKREQGKDKQMSGDTSPKSQGDTLVYAE